MAAVIQTGNALGMAVLKALGIESTRVLEVAIGMKANELATVTIVRSLDKVEGDKLLTELRQYALCATGGTINDSNARAMETVAHNLVKG